MNNEQHADRFVAKYNGVYIDEDKWYGSQCWDTVARYAREEFDCPSFPTVSGGAEGLYRIAGGPILQFFDRVPRDQLKPGDVVVWDRTFYVPWGHTALLWRREGNTLFVLEQDGSKDPNGDGKADGVSYIAQRPITSKISGGLRPKGEATVNKELVERGVSNIILATGTGQAEGLYPTAGQIQYFTKQILAATDQGVDELGYFVYTDKQNQDMRHKAFNEESGLPAVFRELQAAQARVKELEKQIEAGAGGDFVLAPQLYVPKQ